MSRPFALATPATFLSGLLLLAACSGEDSGPADAAGGTGSGGAGASPSAAGTAGVGSPGGTSGTAGSSGAATGTGGSSSTAGNAGTGAGGNPGTAGGGGTSTGGTSSAGAGGTGQPGPTIMVDPGRNQRQDIDFSAVTADPSAKQWHGQQRGTFDGSKKVQGKLVVTMGGIGNGPHTGGVYQYAAGRGFHMLGVDMYNSEGGESNQGKVYLESFSGQDLTPVADVSPANSVHGRIKKGLAYLNTQDPGADWDFYLDAQGEVRWQDVILFGYSYGGQVALAATKFVAPFRTIITASPTLPDDAAWLTGMPNVADPNKCFAINSAGEASKFDKLTQAGWPGTPQIVMNDAFAMVMQPPFMGTSKLQAPGGHTEFCSVAGDRYDVICDFAFAVQK